MDINSIPCAWFIDECQKAFGFLVSDYGFTGPEIEYDSQIRYLFILFKKRDVGVECSYEEREEAGQTRICRLVDGRKPDVWCKDKSGRIIFEYLTQILLYNGIRDFGYKRVPPDKNQTGCQALARRMLTREAELLKEYCSSILEGSADMLDKVTGSMDDIPRLK